MQQQQEANQRPTKSKSWQALRQTFVQIRLTPYQKAVFWIYLFVLSILILSCLISAFVTHADQPALYGAFFTLFSVAISFITIGLLQVRKARKAGQPKAWYQQYEITHGLALLCFFLFLAIFGIFSAIRLTQALYSLEITAVLTSGLLGLFLMLWSLKYMPTRREQASNAQTSEVPLTISPRAYELAELYQFGHPLAEYSTAPRLSDIKKALLFVISTVYLVWKWEALLFLWQHALSSPLASLLIARIFLVLIPLYFLILLSGFIRLIQKYWQRNQCLIICEQGFLLAKNDGIVAFRWQQVQLYKQRNIFSFHLVTFRREDGMTCHLTNTFNRFDDFMLRVCNHVPPEALLRV